MKAVLCETEQGGSGTPQRSLGAAPCGIRQSTARPCPGDSGRPGRPSPAEKAHGARAVGLPPSAWPHLPGGPLGQRKRSAARVWVDGVSLSLACSSLTVRALFLAQCCSESFRLPPPSIAKATGIKVCYTKRLTFLRVNIKRRGVFMRN